MGLNTRIFREYDIRGIVERDLGDPVPEQIGRAFASELRARLGDRRTLSVAIGRDNRPSSTRLSAGVIDGVRAAGVDVLDVGTVPTPLLYYATERFGTDGGMQITGSHNPPEYNGFKMTIGGRALYGDDIQALRDRIENRRFADGAGMVEFSEVIPTYIEDLAGRFSLKKPVKLVVDCGNGTGSLLAVELLRRIGAEVVPLFCESDGTFPNHHPDPTVDENLRELIRLVKDTRADFGVGFDGDADRIGAVDGDGRIVRGDILLLLFGLDALNRLGAPQKMIFDVKCSQAVTDVFAAHGGEPIMWKTGHSLIKEKMKETGAPIAGELSGHICFAENYFGFDDALYAACLLCQLVSRSDLTLAEQVAEFPQYVSTPEIRIDIDEDAKFGIVERAVRDFRGSHEVIDVDGARVLFDGGWGLLRASNTQPVLVLRYEARTSDQLEAIRSAMEGWLAQHGVEVA
jgi:phosphomannomutase/phosphoglucomutase